MKMVYFDSHCHLNDESFAGREGEVIARANQAGVKAMLVLGYDISSSKKAIELAQAYPGVYAAVGFHPENLEGASLDDLATIEELAHHPKVIAIGEIGLDYYWQNDEATKLRQRPFFIAQLELANRLGLPVSIHARNASEDTYLILKEHRPTSGGVLHCYSGSVEMMRQFVGLDMYFGFDGPITYKNAVVPKECVKAAPLDRLLVETDSPYLAPVPMRGKGNEPTYIPYIFSQIAQLRGLDEDFLEQVLNRNFENLFHVKLS